MLPGVSYSWGHSTLRAPGPTCHPLSQWPRLWASLLLWAGIKCWVPRRGLCRHYPGDPKGSYLRI